MVAPEIRGRTKLRRIVVERFRGIESLELDFLDPRGATSPVTVLAGPNGSGKTRVLEACVMALGRFDSVRREWLRRSWFNITPSLRELREQFDGARIRVEVETGAAIREVGVEGEEIAKGLRRSSPVPRDERYATYFSSWRDPRLVGKVPIALQPSDANRERQEDRLGLVKKYLVNAKAYARMAGGSTGGRPAPAPEPDVYELLIGRLNKAWDLFRPDRGEYFSADPAGEGPGGGFDVFMHNRGGRKIPLDWLSSGELQIFTFLGWMITADFSGDVICIDEPELHLDPQWHALAMRAFQAVLPESQFIVTTHSPTLYQSVYSFQRKLLVPDDDPRAGTWREGVPFGAPARTAMLPAGAGADRNRAEGP